MKNDENMTKKDLARIVAEATGLTQDSVLLVIQKTFEEMANALCAGRTLEFRRFGTFEVRQRKARTGRNPRDRSQEFEIPAHKAVCFRPGRALKEQIDG